MSFLAKITDVVGGSLFGSVKELITDYFPPDMSPEKKAELQQKIDEMEFKKQMAILEAAADAEKTLNQRIAEQEGTAKDLKQLPIIGSLVLFLRGLQRPAWGFFTMYLDFEWFTSVPAYTEQQQTALIVINLLVLGFLFGERTVKNLEPLIIKVFGKVK
ncbi:coil containing protein [Vibrio phage 1.184.A._10N.286.49.A5]|nr:coil containing protein [Vibrio phage 1.184.A._10N.286.49.A5]